MHDNEFHDSDEMPGGCMGLMSCLVIAFLVGVLFYVTK
jgi:hypothetical protein